MLLLTEFQADGLGGRHPQHTYTPPDVGIDGGNVGCVGYTPPLLAATAAAAKSGFIQTEVTTKKGGEQQHAHGHFRLSWRNHGLLMSLFPCWFFLIVLAIDAFKFLFCRVDFSSNMYDIPSETIVLVFSFPSVENLRNL